MFLQEKDLCIFNFSLNQLYEAITSEEDIISIINENANPNANSDANSDANPADPENKVKPKTYGPFKKLMGVVINYYFRTELNNLYAVNFIKLNLGSKKKYIVNFHFVKNLKTKQTMDNLLSDQNPNKNAMKLKKIGKKTGTEFGSTGMNEASKVLAAVFGIVNLFFKAFSPDSLWMEPSVAGDEMDQMKERKRKVKDETDPDLFEATKRGRLYLRMAQIGLRNMPTYGVAVSKHYLCIYKKANYKDMTDEEIMNTGSELQVIMSNIIHRVSSMLIRTPKEVLEENNITIAKLLLNEIYASRSTNNFRI